MMDVWNITPAERLRHCDQFSSLQPIGGFITGSQAKGFFLQSGLPPAILAQIWGLADINGDGKMDLNEFSIACKLITIKLNGIDIPVSLPPQMIASLQSCFVPAPPPSTLPLPSMTAMPVIGAQPQVINMPGMIPSVAVMPSSIMHPGGPVGLPLNNMAIPSSANAHMSVGQPIGGQLPMTMSGMTTHPQSVVHPVNAGSVGSSGSSSPAAVSADWAVPLPTRTKYGNVFFQTDRARTGFLAGVQARNILMQSGLPQNILARIWSLSDVDADGRLSTEEFILSGFLCDQATKGEPLPSVLPTNLIPPSLRRGGETGIDMGSPLSATSFEDKRRENFNKGQAELEKRRQSLLETTRREEEERKKKAIEEEATRLKQKQEMERQRLVEWESKRKEELGHHRQNESEKVLQLRAKQTMSEKELEKMVESVKNMTSEIVETRKNVTDAKSFIDGMRNTRDTKMSKLNGLKEQLKDQNNRILIATREKAELDAKVKQNSNDGDSERQHSELSEYERKKAVRLAAVSELRAKLDELNTEEAEKSAAFDENKTALSQNRQKLADIIDSCKQLYEEFDSKRRDVRAEKAKKIRELTDPDHAWHKEHQEDADSVVEDVKTAPVEYTSTQYRAIYSFEPSNEDELAFQAGDIITVHQGVDHQPGWLGGELDGRIGWFPEAYVECCNVDDRLASAVLDAATAYKKVIVCAIFDRVGGKSSEISFSRGDYLCVTNEFNADWWFGYVQSDDDKLSSNLGYFPSSYVTKDLDDVQSHPIDAVPTIETEAPLEPLPPSTMTDQYCMSLFPYESEEPSDLTFKVDQLITILNKDGGEWWTGKIGDRVGEFPRNYVKIVDATSVICSSNTISQAMKSKPTENHNKSVGWDESASHVAHQVSDVVTVEELSTSKVTFVEEKEEIRKSVEDVVVEAQDKTKIKQEEYVESETAKKSSKTHSKKGGSSDSKAPLELVVVMAAYTATSKEQLSLERGQIITVRKKTSTGWWQGEIKQESGKGKKRSVGWFPATYVKSVDSMPSDAAIDDENFAGKEMFRALFPYSGQHEDELAFKAGDLIELIVKEEEAWWKGRCNNKVGVFPSNYVEAI